MVKTRRSGGAPEHVLLRMQPASEAGRIGLRIPLDQFLQLLGDPSRCRLSTNNHGARFGLTWGLKLVPSGK